MASDGEVIEAIPKLCDSLRGYIDLHRIEGPGRGDASVIDIAPRMPGLCGQAVG